MNLLINELENKITVPSEHWYLSSKSGKWFPSVMLILDTTYPKGEGFARYLKQVGMNASQILREYGDIGSNIHNAIDVYAKTNKLTYLSSDGIEKYKFTEEWIPICRAMEFFNRYNPEIIAHEFSFANDELGFGGTIDMICRIEGQVWLIDYKSGNNIYGSHKCQVSAYTKAWNLLNPQYTIERVGLLHLNADTRAEKEFQGKGWKVEEVQDIDSEFEYFQYFQKIFHKTNPNAKPKIMEYPLSFEKKLSEVEALKIEIEKCTEISNLNELWKPEYVKNEEITELFTARKNQIHGNIF